MICIQRYKISVYVFLKIIFNYLLFSHYVVVFNKTLYMKRLIIFKKFYKRFFPSNIFDLPLVESASRGPEGMEGQLQFFIWKTERGKIV